MREYNANKWTEARFRSFIRSALRNASVKWPPRLKAKQDAKENKKEYRCIGYKRPPHLVPGYIKSGKRNIGNVFVDHISPIGQFTTYDELIDKMFCEEDNLQLLCTECHKLKTKGENET